MLILLSSIVSIELVGALFAATEETKLAKYSTYEAASTLQSCRGIGHCDTVVDNKTAFFWVVSGIADGMVI